MVAYFCKSCSKGAGTGLFNCYHCKQPSSTIICAHCASKNKECMTCGCDLSYMYETPKKSYEDTLKDRISNLERENSMLRGNDREIGKLKKEIERKNALLDCIPYGPECMKMWEEERKSGYIIEK